MANGIVRKDAEKLPERAATMMEPVVFENVLGVGVAWRGGLHQRDEVSTMEVCSDMTPQPASR